MFLLKNKLDIFASLRVFLRYVKNRFGKIVIILRSDNGTKFVNLVCHDLCKKLGIVHQRSYPCISQQNGVDERKHRHNLRWEEHWDFKPKYLWHIRVIVLYMQYTLQIGCLSVINNQTSYKRLYGSKPILTHLRTLGWMFFAKNLTEHEKMMTRSKSAVHMGYSKTQNGTYCLIWSIRHFLSIGMQFLEKIYFILNKRINLQSGRYL